MKWDKIVENSPRVKVPHWWEHIFHDVVNENSPWVS